MLCFNECSPAHSGLRVEPFKAVDFIPEDMYNLAHWHMYASMKQMLVMAKGPDKYFELDRDMPSKPH
jgi:hypothetical protein